MNPSDLKKRILDQAAPDLARIEAALEENLSPCTDFVRRVAGHILFAGGKRLRPLLMVLSARLCGYKGDYDAVFSVIFEYLHVATLLHDDLVDGAGLRRGRTVAHHVYGNSEAVLTGDFLLARALRIAAETRRPKVVAVMAKITEEMAQGEIDQLTRKTDLSLSRADYFEVIRRKTAVLFAGAGRLAAILSDAEPDREEALVAYGFHLGMAFQMADDLLDYTADTTKLGKAVGADLKEGKLTLPVIYGLEKASPAQRSQMEQVIKSPEFTRAQFADLVQLLNHLGGIDYTRTQAAGHLSKAKAALSVFQDSPAKELFFAIADFVLARES